MRTEATATLQAEIDARQALEAITYGVRSIEVCRSAWGASACHSAQIVAGCQAAARVTGRFVAQDTMTLRELKRARREAQEQVRAAQAAVKSMGTRRQLRLALAA